MENHTDIEYKELKELDQNNPKNNGVISASLFQILSRFAQVATPILISSIILLTIFFLVEWKNNDSTDSKKYPRYDPLDESFLFISSDDYYATIDFNAKNKDMKMQLKKLVSPHTVISYDEIWKAFPDVYTNLPGYPCNKDLSFIPDVYSSFCWNPSTKSNGGECGIYKKEGDCFNREHIWPKSWFGGFENGMNAQTDLFELYPSDGKVNAIRGNLPLGKVKEATYQSSNGCKVGKCVSTGYSGECFEITDHLKGDIARSYFYLSTIYDGEWKCCAEAGVDKSDILPWMEDVLREWHKADPVDKQEIQKNEVIYRNWQHNRNPFIDHPEWVEQIDDF